MFKNLFFLVVKEIFGFVFRLFGLIHLIKVLNKNDTLYYVFNYHSFSKYNNFKIKRGSVLETGYKDNFERQIKFYKKHFHFSYPNEFFENSNYGHSALITFDDGYKDNHDLALPVLQKHDAKAIFFIVTSITDTNDMLMHDKIRYLIQNKCIDKSLGNIPSKIYKGEKYYDQNLINHINQNFKESLVNYRLMMNITELKTIVNSGFKLGNHTHNHKALTFLSREKQLFEINSSDKFLNQIQEVDTIGYPNGLYNDDTLSINDSLNYIYGFTIIPGVNNQRSSKFELNRIGINASDSINEIVFKVVMNTLGISWI